jgi:hypothetical protein
MIPIKKVYVTKEQADALNVKANCILLNARGKYYYAEEFGKFIEIEEWEYHRILNNPYLYYFSTALKKHFEWCAAVGKARTLTFSDALGQTQRAQAAARRARAYRQRSPMDQLWRWKTLRGNLSRSS